MYDEINWLITPTETPRIIRNCSKCGRKKEFYCSEKFRVNGRHTKIDIWLIYKCTKCDTTWKLTIARGQKPRALNPEVFDGFTNNDKDLAWQYAFDRQLLKQNECEMQYNISYCVEGPDLQTLTRPVTIHLRSLYLFELKLSAFLSSQLNISTSQIKKMAESKAITTSPEYDIMKYRIRAKLDIHLNETSTMHQPCM